MRVKDRAGEKIPVHFIVFHTFYHSAIKRPGKFCDLLRPLSPVVSDRVSRQTGARMYNVIAEYARVTSTP